MPLSERGLEGFWWPLAQSELYGFRDRLHARLATLARTADPGDARLLRIAMPGLLYRAMTLFEASAVIERATAARIKIEPSRGGYSMGPLLRGEALSDDPADPRRRLMRPFAPEPVWRALARIAHNRLSHGPIARRRLFEIDARRSAITVAINPSIVRFAAAEAGPVIYCHPREWFSQATPDDGPGCDRELREAVLEAITDASLQAGAALRADVVEHIDRYVEKGTALARHHLERLLSKPRRLPQKLWTVSGVTSWARVLATAVQLNGGEITGFEHGTGESWSRDCGDTLFEFDVLDRFVCYTPEAARRSGLQQREGIRGRDQDCRMDFLPPQAVAPRATSARPMPTKPRVMLISTLYRLDQFMRYKAALADPVVVDWQARLIKTLSDWGYEPLYRPNPEQTGDLPAFGETFGVVTVAGRFEEALERADILLFDIPLTSAWRDALQAGKPVVLVDFGQSSLARECQALAERRMAVVQAGFDEANRATLDWEALRAALDRAPTLADPGFVTDYFGHA